MKKILALSLALIMVLAVMAGCKKADDNNSSGSETPAKNDKITVMVPPVTGDYQEKIKRWAADFNKKYPNLTLEIMNTSWDDHGTKLSTMAQAGEAPDIAELSYGVIGTYAESFMVNPEEIKIVNAL